MEQVMRLLSERNHYLEKFTLLNRDELARMAQGDFDHIDEFYQCREDLLSLVQHVERRLDQITKSESKPTPGDTAVSEGTRELARQQLRLRDQLVTLILDQDLQIISMIEKAKTQIIKDLRSLRKNKKAVGAYHSGNINHALDEEV